MYHKHFYQAKSNILHLQLQGMLITLTSTKQVTTFRIYFTNMTVMIRHWIKQIINTRDKHLQTRTKILPTQIQEVKSNSRKTRFGNGNVIETAMLIPTV